MNGPRMKREGASIQYKHVNARALDRGFEDKGLRGRIACCGMDTRKL